MTAALCHCPHTDNLTAWLLHLQSVHVKCPGWQPCGMPQETTSPTSGGSHRSKPTQTLSALDHSRSTWQGGMVTISIQIFCMLHGHYRPRIAFTAARTSSFCKRWTRVKHGQHTTWRESRLLANPACGLFNCSADSTYPRVTQVGQGGSRSYASQPNGKPRQLLLVLTLAALGSKTYLINDSLIGSI